MEKEYSGPDTNETYSNEETYESFEDLDDDGEELEDPTDGQQSSTSHEENDDVAEEQEHEDKKSSKLSKKEAAKKARGQKGDDLDSLERENEESFEDLNDDEEEEAEEKEEKPDAKKEDKPAEEDKKEETAEEKKAAKGKPTYVKVDGETYALDSNSLISLKVNGKNEEVPLQELKNNYAGKVAYDSKMNEANVKEINHKREVAAHQEKISQFNGVKQKIEEIIADPEKNPQDALKIFLDSVGVDSYDLMERVFKSHLTEVAKVLNMETAAERKAYFLEKRNSHLLEQSKKRDEQTANAERVNSYRTKADALRKSHGVSEAQYVDALEELKTFGTEEKDISEQDIVEWAATKPHRAEVKTLLEPYLDQFDTDGAYGELSWKLAGILRSGKETKETIKKHLAEVYGVPTEVKELSKKLNPLGRKSQAPAKIIPKNKRGYESFEDIDD